MQVSPTKGAVEVAEDVGRRLTQTFGMTTMTKAEYEAGGTARPTKIRYGVPGVEAARRLAGRGFHSPKSGQGAS